MARLIVEAVTDEAHGGDVVGDVLVFVSVSLESDGKPVTGLKVENFRVASSIGSVINPVVTLVAEMNWEPDKQYKEPSGCYSVWITRGKAGPSDSPHWTKGELYAFGIQVMRFEKQFVPGPKGKKPHWVEVPVDFGQTVVSVESLGE